MFIHDIIFGYNINNTKLSFFNYKNNICNSVMVNNDIVDVPDENKNKNKTK